MSLLLNRCSFTTATTGTGTITVGSAVSKYQTPASAGATNGSVYSYFIEDGTAWEIGTGTYTSAGTTLSRTLIQSSTGSLLSLSGSATVTIASNIADFATPDLFGTPAAPQSGLVRLGETALAGCDWPSWRSAVTPERFVNPLMSRTRWGNIQFSSNLASPTAIGISLNNFRNAGLTNYSAGGASGDSYGWRQPKAALVTAATPGALAYYSPQFSAAVLVSVGAGSNTCGFFCSFAFTFGTNANDCFAFVGLQSSTAVPTSVDPTGLTNQIGLARRSGSNNWWLTFAGGTAQTPIDLGASFPANTGSTADFYRLELFSDANDNSVVRWQVTRWGSTSNAPTATTSGSITNTTPGTTLPATTTALGPAWWVSNNANAVAVQLAPSHFYYWAE